VKPALLLIGGMLNDERVWDYVAPPLRDVADVYLLAPDQASIEDMARAAWNRLAVVASNVPIVVAGFSLGGYVLAEMLAQPQRPLSAAAFVSSTAQPETEKSLVWREKTLQALQTDFPAAMARTAQYGMYEPLDAQLAFMLDMMQRVGAQTAIRQVRAIAQRRDHRAALAALDLPVMVLCGRHDRVTPPAFSEDLVNLIPHARCEILENAGHMLPVQQPEDVVRVLRSLLPQSD